MNTEKKEDRNTIKTQGSDKKKKVVIGLAIATITILGAVKFTSLNKTNKKEFAVKMDKPIRQFYSKTNIKEIMNKQCEVLNHKNTSHLSLSIIVQ